MATTLAELGYGKALLYGADGRVSEVDGPFPGRRLREILECELFQYVPCTVGALGGRFELWMDEEGLYSGKAVNESASAEFGDQVCGGVLLGAVLVKHQTRYCSDSEGDSVSDDESVSENE